jgi:ABC-type Fe3+/spermidine/putrescine transport system ATPase subunit
MLKLNSVNKTFNKNSLDEYKALDNVNLHLAEGEFVTVIGGNGAGKSTLFNAISGSVLCDSGKIILDGQDITYMPEHKRASFIGRVFQDPMRGTAPNMTVGENLTIAYMRSINRNMMGVPSKPIIIYSLIWFNDGCSTGWTMPIFIFSLPFAASSRSAAKPSVSFVFASVTHAVNTDTIAKIAIIANTFFIFPSPVFYLQKQKTRPNKRTGITCGTTLID